MVGLTVLERLRILRNLGSIPNFKKLNSLNFLSSLPPPRPNLASEGVRCGLDMKIARMRHTLTYFSFWLLIERSQMTPYHAKLSEVRA